MPSGQSIVSRALRLISALGTGEPVSTQLQTDMLEALNAMIDSWNTERYIIYSVERQTFTLIANTNPHTIGAGGNINVTRPIKVDKASIVDAASGIEYRPMEDLSIERWQAIPNKTFAGLPASFFYDPQLDASSRARLYLWPIPQSAYTIALYLWTQLSSAMTWAGTTLMPPGYARALAYNLAVEISSEFDRTPTEVVYNIAVKSKAAIKAVNIPTLYANIDEALLPQGSAIYNIYTNATN